MTKNLIRQHERILFMISLPQTAEFETCKDYVSDCINKLSERGVDVCESIHREDLAAISQYDIVIIVAHHDTDDDALLLADGKLSMDDFIDSIPEDFCGELDFSSCYSVSAMKAIKDRCPNCHIQVSIHQTTLALRLMAYPFVIDIINDDEKIEYHDAYMKVLDMILEAASDTSEDDEGFELVKLGQKMTSVYSPKEVMRNSVFQILVFFHYDFEKEVVLVKVDEQQDNAKKRSEFEIPISLEIDDEIDITLSFESTDNDNIKVKNDEYTKVVTIKEEIIEEEFIVTLLPDFQCNSFLAQIEMAKDGVCFVKTRPFNINVTDRINKIPADIVMEIPVNEEKLIPQLKSSDLLKLYYRVFNTALLYEMYKDDNDKRLFEGKISDGFKVIQNKKMDDDLKVYEAGKFIYDRSEDLIKQIKSHIEDNDNQTKNENNELLSRINKSFIKLKKKADKLDAHFKKIKFDGKGNIIRFQDAIKQDFAHIEYDFLSLVSDVMYLDSQIYLLEKVKEIRTLINKSSKDIVSINNKATDFFTIVDKYGIDKDLFNMFRKDGKPSIIHSRTDGVTASFLALLLAMACLKYESTKIKQKDWSINVLQYMDKNLSVTTIKRMNDVVSLLNNNNVIDNIKKYNSDKDIRVSISSYYLQKVKVSII